MFKNSNNPYTLRTEIVEGCTRYYVSFTDGVGNRHDTVVSYPVYKEFLRFVIIERSLRHWDERHREHYNLSDEELHKRVLYPAESLEKTVLDGIKTEHMRAAMQTLTETQQRRLVLYYDFDLTNEQIADIEGCTKMPVKRSIMQGIRKVRKIIKDF